MSTRKKRNAFDELGNLPDMKLNPDPLPTAQEPKVTNEEPDKVHNPRGAGRKAAIKNSVRVVLDISPEAKSGLLRIASHFVERGRPGTMGYAADQAILHFLNEVVKQDG